MMVPDVVDAPVTSKHLPNRSLMITLQKKQAVPLERMSRLEEPPVAPPTVFTNM